MLGKIKGKKEKKKKAAEDEMVGGITDSTNMNVGKL